MIVTIIGHVNNIPKMQFSLEFPEILIQNLTNATIDWVCLGPGNSERLQFGILISMPYWCIGTIKSRMHRFDSFGVRGSVLRFGNKTKIWTKPMAFAKTTCELLQDTIPFIMHHSMANFMFIPFYKFSLDGHGRFFQLIRMGCVIYCLLL